MRKQYRLTVYLQQHLSFLFLQSEKIHLADKNCLTTKTLKKYQDRRRNNSLKPNLKTSSAPPGGWLQHCEGTPLVRRSSQCEETSYGSARGTGRGAGCGTWHTGTAVCHIVVVSVFELW